MEEWSVLPLRAWRVADSSQGTTLEALGANVSTPLWGCDLLQSSPDTIRNVHQQFTASGADIIQTATSVSFLITATYAHSRYQLTLPSLCSHLSIDESTAKGVMQSAIPLASTSHGHVALSIGPFGATLSPGQEYAGVYPPPYGPPPTSTPSNRISDPEVLKDAIDALEKFHLDRLLAFSDDGKVWSQVEWIAFETIPVLYEYAAIRRAMQHLVESGRGKKFWISSAYPEGRHPQTYPGGKNASVEDVLEAALGGELPPANAIGVNCTNPTYIASLAEDFTSTLLRLRQDGKIARNETAFVLYPDGGSVYDVNTRTWSSGGIDATSWGNQVAAVARSVDSKEQHGAKVWAGVIVGGCCKAGFDEIRALRQSLDIS